tara:strand:- start:653 stop:1279 length:627 start_codon:yes stop_codon:yes gene_type:complete
MLLHLKSKGGFIMMKKWFALGLGGLIGISHIGLIGMVSRKSDFPIISPPVGPYTSYIVSADKEGYRISYNANDPKTMFITKDIKQKAGFLGLSNNTTKITEEYVMDGATNQGGPVSNHRSWLDQTPGLTDDQTREISEYRKSEACIKAIGSAEGTGRIVGTSIGASAAPTLANIPFVGWVASGWVAMFGGNQGSDIAGNMAKGLNKNC